MYQNDEDFWTVETKCQCGHKVKAVVCTQSSDSEAVRCTKCNRWMIVYTSGGYIYEVEEEPKDEL